MLKQKINSRRGFTIIEVVLVLAIAGLIFLMVFLALPALQRSQRDTQRRDKLGEFKTQITQYQSNNRGRVPSSYTEWQRVVDDYMNLGKTKDGGFNLNSSISGITNDDVPFLDSDGEKYYIAYWCDLKTNTNTGTTTATGVTNAITGCSANSGQTIAANLKWDNHKHQIYVFNHARCDGENVKKQDKDGDRLVAFVTKLEGAGIYCGEN